jgi:hypothetical protein
MKQLLPAFTTLLLIGGSAWAGSRRVHCFGFGIRLANEV